MCTETEPKYAVVVLLLVLGLDTQPVIRKYTHTVCEIQNYYYTILLCNNIINVTDLYVIVIIHV